MLLRALAVAFVVMLGRSAALLSRGARGSARAYLHRVAAPMQLHLRPPTASPSAPTARHMSSAAPTSASSTTDLSAAIAAKGEQIRQAKALKAPTLKQDLAPLVAELLALKADYKQLTGQDFGAPPKEDAGGQQAQTQKPSKPVPTPAAPASSPASSSAPTPERPSVDYYTVPDDTEIAFGDFRQIASQGRTGRVFADAKTLGLPGGAQAGAVVWLRGRVSSMRAKGNACFAILRCDALYTVQVCHFKDAAQADQSKGLIKV